MQRKLIAVAFISGALIAGAACGGAGPGGNQQPGSANVTGPLVLDAERVAAVRRATGAASEAAVATVSEDMLLAAELRRSNAALAAQLTRIGLARALLVELQRESARQGPPRDAEVAALTQQRWWQLARPRMARVTHAVVLAGTPDSRAQALAERIARATSGAHNAQEFRTLVEKVASEGMTVKVEDLPPVAPDGRSVDPAHPPPEGPRERTFDSDFARAAAELDAVGAMSPVVRSKFGYHVLFLTGSIPEAKPTLEERRRMLQDEILVVRSRALADAISLRQRQASTPSMDRATLELTARIEGAER